MNSLYYSKDFKFLQYIGTDLSVIINFIYSLYSVTNH